MPDTPAWWRQVVTDTRARRRYTGMLLAHATPSIDGGELRLTFTDPAIAGAWRASNAQAALEGALEQHRIPVAVKVTTPAAA